MSAHTATKGFLMSASTIVLAALGVRGCVIRRAALSCAAPSHASLSVRRRASAPCRGNAPYACAQRQALAEEQGSVRALANFDVLSDYSSSL